MNDIDNVSGNRKPALWIALLVALLGLTIAPGFECTHKSADGSETRVVV
jgi:hypothetical protein